MIPNELATYFDGAFKDNRLNKRANKTLGIITRGCSLVINHCFATLTEKIGTYRMFNNKKMEESAIKRQLSKNCARHITSDHVLCIQDTSEVNFTSKQGRIRADDPDIGPVSRNTDSGFYLHPMLAIDAASHEPLGFTAVKTWNRHRDKLDKKKRAYHRQPVEEKESYRWIEVARESLDSLPGDTRQTVIADREGDIYELFHLLPGPRCDLLIRSSSNRVLVGENSLLLEYMQSLPVEYSYQLEIKGNHSRQNRLATLDLRYAKVEIKKPGDLKGDYPPSISLSCVHVVERAQSVPAGEPPVEWRLLTTHPVESVQDALQLVEWYKLRWYIEEIFRLLKSDGLNIEQAQLASGSALKKLALIGLIAAWHIMSLKLALDRQEEKTPATMLFTPLQVELLLLLTRKVEGNTCKQKNPFKQNSLPWAAWIIARLAGWSGYSSHGKAGYITLKRGYQDFQAKYQVFELIKDVYKE